MQLESRIAEEPLGQLGVAARGTDEEQPLRHLRVPRLAVSPTTSRGIPLKTPAKSVIGSPTSILPFSNRSSRIVRSCIPVRFLITESAVETAPRCSKYRRSNTVSAR